MRALISVYNKNGVVEFARSLNELGWDLYSTGGTKDTISNAGIQVSAVEALTGFPEILDGRVKTLHPMIHGGILARRDVDSHLAQLAQHKILPIDMVVANLYPFIETISKPNVSFDDAIENIDIGGPTNLRSAAKNFSSVIVISDPEDYGWIIKSLLAGDLSQDERQRLAYKAFQHVAAYDTAISRYLNPDPEEFPRVLTVAMERVLGLRYGENPHQKAAFYRDTSERVTNGHTVTSARQLQGKELSFNNIVDADAAWKCVCDFSAPTVAIIKHTNPCGLSSNEDLVEAYKRAFDGDPVSAYGGVVAINRPVNEALAKEISPIFYEVLIAPSYEEGALNILKRKRDLRILETGGVMDIAKVSAWEYRNVSGGFLLTAPDSLPEDAVNIAVVTERGPSQGEIDDLMFAWRAVKHVKSNAIVLVKDKALLGMGAGQPNRVTSVELAVKRAGEKTRGSVLASDAFFPFPDGVEEAARAGVTAIIEPGGSIRDNESIEVCNKNGIAMIFTGERHFRH
ncbi:MAG: bifunctional phosphoribosylaminoimidazolecarboxamide formyltransferase/IMP cyclohydrolase [Dehalococcoidia bacterium]|nr:bifunctional phosphoribosylaminoimidazolecarboxamide formyltransferase/IMP cyclohydrolase [Dehalococcoidia bacterium]